MCTRIYALRFQPCEATRQTVLTRGPDRDKLKLKNTGSQSRPGRAYNSNWCLQFGTGTCNPTWSTRCLASRNVNPPAIWHKRRLGKASFEVCPLSAGSHIRHGLAGTSDTSSRGVVLYQVLRLPFMGASAGAQVHHLQIPTGILFLYGHQHDIRWALWDDLTCSKSLSRYVISVWMAVESLGESLCDRRCWWNLLIYTYKIQRGVDTRNLKSGPTHTHPSRKT